MSYEHIRNSDWFRSIVNEKKSRGWAFENNVETLCSGLDKGQHYVAKNGRLYVQSHHSLWEKVKYFFLRSKQESAVNHLIKETIKPLTDVSSEKWNESVPQEALRELFFERMAHLSNRIFDRSTLPKNFTYVLDPELAQIKKRKTVESAGDPLVKLERRVEKTRLAIKLGVELKPISQGNSGSYFAQDYKKKVLGVFKPGQEESLGSKSPKLVTRIRNFVQFNILKVDAGAPFWKNEGYLAEAMTSQLANHLGFETVPASRVESFTSKALARAKIKGEAVEEKGSFQLFVKGSKSAQNGLHLGSKSPLFGGLLLKLNTWRYKDQISKKLDQHEFEEMALIDFALCNRDRHFENWLLTKDPDTGKQHIHLIDHQLAFPKYNPPQGDILYRRNQYKWDGLPQAMSPFSDEMKKKAYILLTGQSFKDLLQRFHTVNDEQGMGFAKISQDGNSQERAFKQRIAILLKGMEKNYSLKDLARIKSQEEMDAFFVEHQINDIDDYLMLKKERN
jgi:hypothetical protein